MDYRTLFVVVISALLIQSSALMMTWLKHKDQVGIRDWAFGAMCLVFSSLTSSIGLFIEPDRQMLSYLLRDVGTVAATIGWLFLWIGVRHFKASKSPSYRYLIPLALVLYIILSQETEAYWRMTIVSSVIAALSLVLLLEFAHRTPWRRDNTIAVLFLFGINCIAWLGRALSRLDGDSTLNAWDSFSLYMSIITSFGVSLIVIMANNDRINRELSKMATRDSLTGALNRRAFLEKSDALLATLARSTNEMSICIVDLDHFKKFNDQYGHSAGDEVLREFSAMARSMIRPDDLFGRYGGEEFVLLLNGSSQQEAAFIVDRIRERCQREGIELEGGERLNYTFSAGLCFVRGPTVTEFSTILNAADECLYQAKKRGRNQLVSRSFPGS